MRKTALFAAAGLLLASPLALAQVPYADDATYRGLGGQEGIGRITATFLELVLADPRIKDSFADFDIPQIRRRLQEQFCEYAGGPCKYTGKYRDRTMDGTGTVRDMQSVHIDLHITDEMFNALAEDLQLAMARHGVSSAVSNRLIAKLAPMHRDIVTASAPLPSARPDMGRFLATGGVSMVEGAGGGGISPWALITGYGTRDSWGGNVHYTRVQTQDYSLATRGVAVGIADRVELSLARQDFQGDLAPLDLLRIQQDIVGVKIKLAGDAVYGQDRAMPQVALGVMYKKNRGVGGLGALGVTNVKQLGAQDDSGVDYYLSAAKICLEHSLLVNGTLRATKANQMGILGFGGDVGGHARLQPEVSVAWLAHRTLAIGAEYRHKPHNLGVDPEKASYDVFAAWFPNKNLSLTAAYANLGTITVFNPRTQKGWYLSLQMGL